MNSSNEQVRQVVKVDGTEILRAMAIKVMKLMKKEGETGAQNSFRRFIRGKTIKYTTKEKDAPAKLVLEYKEENVTASKSSYHQ